MNITEYINIFEYATYYIGDSDIRRRNRTDIINHYDLGLPTTNSINMRTTIFGPFLFSRAFQIVVPRLLGDYVGTRLIVAHQHRGNLCSLSGNDLIVVEPVDRDGLHERVSLCDDPVRIVCVVARDNNPGTA